VHVEGLDRQGFQHRIVDLTHGETRQLLVQAAIDAPKLGHRAAVVVEALELDDLHALDAALG
jgi:hypothetical protein